MNTDLNMIKIKLLDAEPLSLPPALASFEVATSLRSCSQTSAVSSLEHSLQL